MITKIIFCCILCECHSSQIFAAYQATGTLVLEEIVDEFLLYMDVVAILVKWLRYGKQTFIPWTHWSSIWNLALTDPVVSEKTFEKFRWIDNGAYQNC